MIPADPLRAGRSQGYQFRGIDDIYNALNAALSEHEVFAVPKVLDIKREERASKGGGTLLYTILTVQYTFFAADGSFFECITIGEAMDSGDKSCNKAMSAAQKYAFLQVFSIPTEEPKDSENATYTTAPRTRTEGNGQAASAPPSEPPSAAAPQQGEFITAEQARDLELLVQDLKMSKIAFLKTYGAESFAAFPSAKFGSACTMLSAKQQKAA
ncbi:MAG: ERF family protein [Syntrophobacteraceae bacterium]